MLFAATLLLLEITPTGRVVPPKVETTTLSNGLRVYIVEDHSAPIVTFQYWVEAGSADERDGTTGLAHFFEHLMFKGTPKVPRYFDAVAGLGGQLNAFTWVDETVYWEKVPTDSFEAVLDLESDRLAAMTVDFLGIEPEREVVKSERLLRTENSASGSLYEAVGATVFQYHSYHWPTVGWMRDLDTVSIDEARSFHRRFYGAGNAFVVIVGDVKAKAALAAVTKRFGALAKGTLERPPRIPEPIQERERRTYVEKPTAAPLLQFAWRSPAGGDNVFLHFELLKSVLVDGKQSRLQQALVHGERPLASSVSAFLFPFVDPGAFILEVQLLPGVSRRAVEAAVEREIARVRSSPIGAAELARAVSVQSAAVVRGMATTQSRAQLMGFAIRSQGDPLAPWTRLAEYGTTSAGELRVVAEDWLTPERRTVGYAVDPQELVKLAKGLVTEAPSGVDGVDDGLVAAVEYAVAYRRHENEKGVLAAEAAAIEALEARAAAEKPKGDPAAIEDWLENHGKGAAGRRKRLAERKTALRSGEKALGAARSKAVCLLAGKGQGPCNPDEERFGAEEPPARYLSAQGLLGGRASGGRGAPIERALVRLVEQHAFLADAAGLADELARIGDNNLSEAGRAIADYAHAARHVEAGKR